VVSIGACAWQSVLQRAGGNPDSRPDQRGGGGAEYRRDCAAACNVADALPGGRAGAGTGGVGRGVRDGGSYGPARPGSGRARRGRRRARTGGGDAQLRSRPGADVARAAAVARRRRIPAARDPAPHHRRRVVARGVGQRAEPAVRKFRGRGAIGAGRVGGAVRRLCDMAAGMAQRGGVPAAAELLEGATPGTGEAAV